MRGALQSSPSADLSKEPTTHSSLPAPNLSTFLGLGFRPLYLAGTAWALIAICLYESDGEGRAADRAPSDSVLRGSS